MDEPQYQTDALHWQRERIEDLEKRMATLETVMRRVLERTEAIATTVGVKSESKPL